MQPGCVPSSSSERQLATAEELPMDEAGEVALAAKAAAKETGSASDEGGVEYHPKCHGGAGENGGCAQRR